MSRDYLTVAAFASQSDAESLRGELQHQGIEASVVDEPIATAHGAAGEHAHQVQVPWNAFDLASRHVAAASRSAPGPERRQFSLRAVFLIITVACVLLAIVRAFGPARAFWGVFFVAGGAVSIVAGVVGVRRDRASCGWPGVRGRIIHAFIEDAGSDDYKSRIGYRFTLGGCDYTGDTIRHVGKTRSGMRNGYEIAREDLMRYPAGREVDVFYDPARPQHAVLQRGAKLREGVLPCLVGLAFIAAGIAVFTGWLSMLP